MTKISIVSPCYNEQANVGELATRIESQMARFPQYDYEIIFIDNCSTDETPDRLRELALKNKKIKVIFNSRNFGHIKSPVHALKQAHGDAVILMASDLQDPPDLISQFITEWQNGAEVVMAVKNKSAEGAILFFIRQVYYDIVNKLSEIPLVKNFTGFGLYDRKFINVLREINDPYPYFRGLVLEIGFKVKTISFTQPLRRSGLTKNNFFTLFDMAMLGIVSHSRIPLRFATLAGFFCSALSILVAILFLFFKLIFWNDFSFGLAPLTVGMFFFASVQLFFLGVIGEYLGFIFVKVNPRPLVVERERLNFDSETSA